MAKRPAVFERKTAIDVLRATKRVLRSPAGAFGDFSPASIPDVVLLMGKLDGDLTAGENSQTVSIWASFGGDAPTDTGIDVDAWGWLLTSDLSSGDEVLIVLANGRWEVVGGGGGSAPDCEATLDDAISDDSDNCLALGSDGRLFVDCTDKVSTDANNLISAGTDNGALLTASAMIDAETDNALTVGANNKLMLDPVDLIDAETPNGLSIGSNGELHVDPDDLISSDSDNLIEAGTDGKLWADATAGGGGGTTLSVARFDKTAAQASISSGYMTLSAKAGDSEWALNGDGYTMDLTGSPDWVHVRALVQMKITSTSQITQCQLLNPTTQLVNFEVLTDATRDSASVIMDYIDFSPGTNPSYRLQLTAGVTGTITAGHGTYHSNVICTAANP